MNMSTRDIHMNKLIGFMISFIICTSNHNSYAFDLSTSSISLSIKNESLKVVTENVFDQTGYTLVFPENFYSMKVSGNFNKVTLEQLIARVLKGMNHSLIINEEETLVIVSLFDSSHIRDKKYDAIGQGDLNSPEHKYDELVRIGKRNEEEFQNFKNDPNSIDPISGLSFREVWERAASGEAAIKNFVNSYGSIDPFSGAIMGQVREIAKANSNKLEAFLSNPDSIDPSSGKAIQEVRRIAHKQQLELDQYPIKGKL